MHFCKRKLIYLTFENIGHLPSQYMKRYFFLFVSFFSHQCFHVVTKNYIKSDTLINIIKSGLLSLFVSAVTIISVGDLKVSLKKTLIKETRSFYLQ